MRKAISWAHLLFCVYLILFWLFMLFSWGIDAEFLIATLAVIPCAGTGIYLFSVGSSRPLGQLEQVRVDNKILEAKQELATLGRDPEERLTPDRNTMIKVLSWINFCSCIGLALLWLFLVFDSGADWAFLDLQGLSITIGLLGTAGTGICLFLVGPNRQFVELGRVRTDIKIAQAKLEQAKLKKKLAETKEA